MSVKEYYETVCGCGRYKLHGLMVRKACGSPRVITGSKVSSDGLLTVSLQDREFGRKGEKGSGGTVSVFVGSGIWELPVQYDDPVWYPAFDIAVETVQTGGSHYVRPVRTTNGAD